MGKRQMIVIGLALVFAETWMEMGIQILDRHVLMMETEQALVMRTVLEVNLINYHWDVDNGNDTPSDGTYRATVAGSKQEMPIQVQIVSLLP